MLTAFAVTVSSTCTVGVAQDAAQEEEKEQTVEEMMEEAERIMRQGNFANAAKLFKKVTEKDDSVGLAWQRLGYSLHAAGDLDGAIEIHKKAAEFDRFKPVSLYNLGCAYSLKEQPDKAFDYLMKAADAGFTQVSHVEGDSDLDNIRDDPRFKKFIAKMKGDDEPKEKKTKSFSG